MQIEVTREFEKDTKKITEKERQRLDEIVVRLAKSESLGKQLHHMKDVFSVYIGNKRLVYKAVPEHGRIVLLFFKSREGVYDYLR